ncbi:MAG: hypothetical protein O3C68_06510 [Proteobacteria bacterium]|nr:hypothetical protein [Pseudomonadota bacterium]
MSSGRNTKVGGPWGITWRQYVEDIERYLAFEDPPKLLRQRLYKKVEQVGFNSLSAAARTFYAMDQFLDSLGSNIEEHLTKERHLRPAIVDGFGILTLECDGIEYSILCESFDRGDPKADYTKHLAQFMDSYEELTSILEEYAEEKGLYLS